MARRPNSSEPAVYHRERLTPSLLAMVAVVLVCVAFMLGPVHLLGILGGQDPIWLQATLWGTGFGVAMAGFISIYNYRTVLIISDRAIRVLDRTIPLERITGWVLVEGKELRRWRRRLLGDQGGSHGIGIGIWMLRGGRNKVFAPPWMPAGFLLDGLGEPVLVGTRHPQRFLTALQAALTQTGTQAVGGGQPWDAPRSGIPPEFREQAWRMAGQPLAQPPPAGPRHGRREQWPR